MPSPSAHFPDLDNILILPKLLEFNLEHNATLPAIVFPEQGTGKIVQVLMLEYIRAIYRAGTLALKRDGELKPGDVVAIIANLDSITYTALINGLINVGIVPFPISPRNSPPAIVNLLRKSSAHKIFTTQTTLKGLMDEVSSEVHQLGDHFALSIQEAPTLQELYPYLGKETLNDPFDSTPRAYYAKDDETALYLHSSGSTGLPKAIRLSQAHFKSYISVLCIKDMRDLQLNPYGSAGLPPFHVMAVFNQAYPPLYGLVPVALFTPMVTKPDALPLALTPENVFENARLTKSDSLLAVPTFVALWSHSEEAIEYLKTCKFVFFGGGPLPKSTGDYLVSRGVNLVVAYGGTEFALVIRARPTLTEEWEYLEFVDKVTVRWVPQGDGSFEAHYIANEHYHPAIENLPDAKGYASSDLFVPHPTNPKIWKIVGRADDVIIHSSGEKTVPAPLEAIITASPAIQGAIFFGRERDQAGLLVEPSPKHKVDVTDITQVAAFRNLVWPFIEEANKIAPAYSRIFKEMILIAPSNKPLPRVGKGTVARKAAIALYDNEINELYALVESNAGGDSVDPPKTWNEEDVQAWLLGQIKDVLPDGANGADVHPTKDLFEQGFDSIMATILRLRIVTALRKSDRLAIAREVPQTLVYTYPSVERLTAAILEFLNNPNVASRPAKTQIEFIEEMIEKYSQGLNDPPPAPKVPFNNSSHFVLVTGTTGNIGAELLAGLVATDSVQRIYALNRSSSKLSILDRHRARFEDKGLDISVLTSPKLVFLEGDASDENLGLTKDNLDELRQNLTIIIHNAWRLDFNLSLSSFESHIQGARSLIDFARSCHHSSDVRFLFTSSIASTQSWDAEKGPYPEEVITDVKYAVGSGYGESKYVTERILAKSGLQATSFRIGQVAGGEPNGAWAVTDWLPILVKTSLTLNKLPDAHGYVSWVPMDAVSRALLDTAFLEGHAPIAVNILHPNPTSWSAVMQNIRHALISEKGLPSNALPVIPIQQWVEDIQTHQGSASDDLPALKLLEFFKLQANADDSTNKGESMRLTPLNIENVKRISPGMKNLRPLDESIARKWVSYWARSGM